MRACLAKDPADRFQSAHDVAMDLRWIAESADGRNRQAFGVIQQVMGRRLGCASHCIRGARWHFVGYRWAKSSEEPVSIHAEIRSA